MTEETILDKAKGGGDWDEPLIYYSYELLAGSYSTDPITFRPASNNVPVLFKVPGACKYLKVDCVGATGGGNSGGAGGRVQCILDVRENKRLYIFAGKSHGTSYDSRVYDASHISTSYSYNEGNTSALNQRLVVAGAGGNRYQGYGAGAGGGLTGGTAAGDIIHPGYGGTQTAGGAPSHNIRGSIRGTPNFGNAGVFGYGGSGPYPGGAGWYGGGSGGTCYVSKAGTQWAGAGGGSSYTKSGLCKEVVHTQGYNKNGNGWVTIQCLRGGVTIPNFEVVGSPTIDENYNVSGFSLNDYVKIGLNKSVTTKNLEIQLKITTPKTWTISGYEDFIAYAGDNYKKGLIDINIYSANNPYVSAGFHTDTDTFSIKVLKVIELNKTYWFKITYDGKIFRGYNSLDGKIWNLYEEKIYSENEEKDISIEKQTYYVGLWNPDRGTDRSVFPGTIHLSESYIKANGEILWASTTKT